MKLLVVGVSLVVLVGVMQFHRLRYFLEVVRQGQFSRAAEVRNVSQPSLSQQIQKLEGDVGGSLLVRGRGGVTLTELGEEHLVLLKDWSLVTALAGG